jgi:hypothetical protein
MRLLPLSLLLGAGLLTPGCSPDDHDADSRARERTHQLSADTADEEKTDLHANISIDTAWLDTMRWNPDSTGEPPQDTLVFTPDDADSTPPDDAGNAA